jgi:uncharacterized membrane protein
MDSRPERTLLVAASVSLLAALALALPVAERVAAAAWQWFKFYGYSNNGQVNLSFSTGLEFTGAAVVTFGLAWVLNRLAKRKSAVPAELASRAAIGVCAAALGSYWILGMSSLNAWRP